MIPIPKMEKIDHSTSLTPMKARILECSLFRTLERNCASLKKSMTACSSSLLLGSIFLTATTRSTPLCLNMHLKTLAKEPYPKSPSTSNLRYRHIGCVIRGILLFIDTAVFKEGKKLFLHSCAYTRAIS